MKTMSASVEESAEGLRKRKELYPQYEKDFSKGWITHNLNELKQLGYTVIRGFAEHYQVYNILNPFNYCCQIGFNLQPSRDLRNITDPKDWQQANKFSAEDMRKGQKWLAGKTNILQAEEPLVNFPALAHMALDERILDIGGAYLGALPLMSFAKLRKSLANDLPLFDTELFHIDGNSTNMMKAMLLLSDMTPETGAHDFVVGTQHTLESDGSRWTYDEILDRYGKDKIHTITGKAGDLIIEDTSGLHRAVRPVTGTRTVAIFNYVLHPEYGYDQVGWPKVKLPKTVWEQLTDKQKSATGELEIV